MKKHLLFILVAITGLTSCVEEPKLYQDTYEGNFEALWKLIDTRYCFLDYKQINWDSIYVVYHAHLDVVHDDLAFFDLMANMLNELKDGHVNLYSGFDISRYWKWYTDYPSNFNDSLIHSDRYLGEHYRIASGIDYAIIDGGDIGYVYYSSFSNGFSDSNIKFIFDYFKNCKGLIIDVRDNGGGSVDYAEKLASYFFDKKTLTGYISHKTGDGHADFSDPIPVYTTPDDSLIWKKPVAVLTNRLAYSATNLFVCRMKEAPRAIIVGDRTGGGGGLPLSNELPNGWMVRFSACPMYDALMRQTEWGLDPDVNVTMSKSGEKNGFDSIIETAVQYLKR